METTDQPWLPDDIDETFDPLSYADVSPAPETPIVVTPRGGAREVGRSCFDSPPPRECGGIPPRNFRPSEAAW